MDRQITSTDYDKACLRYKDATLRPLRKYSYEPTIFRYLPDLDGKRILDLGCADGTITRRMSDHGAKEIVGLDLSEQQINLARNQDTKRIIYGINDCMHDDLTNLGKFDLVTGFMLLQDAKTRNSLENIALNIKNSLNQNGSFYAMLVNPDLILSGYDDYGLSIQKTSTEGKEVKIKISDFEGKTLCDLTDVFWTRDTYQKAFEKQGFKVKWHNGIVSDLGIEKYESSFWKNYLENPVYVMMQADIKQK